MSPCDSKITSQQPRDERDAGRATIVGKSIPKYPREIFFAIARVVTRSHRYTRSRTYNIRRGFKASNRSRKTNLEGLARIVFHRRNVLTRMKILGLHRRVFSILPRLFNRAVSAGSGSETGKPRRLRVKINSRGNWLRPDARRSAVRRSADIFFVAAFIGYPRADEQFTGQIRRCVLKGRWFIVSNLRGTQLFSGESAIAENGRAWSVCTPRTKRAVFSTTNFRWSIQTPAISDN